MKEYHLIPFIFAYYSLCCKLEKDIKVPYIESLNSKTLVYIMFIPLLALIFGGVSSGVVEQYAVLCSYVIGAKSLKYLVSKKQVSLNKYVSATTLAGILIMIYTNPFVRQNLFLFYFLYIALCLQLVGKEVNTLSEIIDDVVLCHLAFYFTK